MDERQFSFGKNWQIFLKDVNDDHIKNAVQSLTEFLQTDNLKQKTFLDIGCGSGLFSYAAYLMGAEKIVSIDVDPFSVACCRVLHEKANKPAHWQVMEGSIMDANLLLKLECSDVVYSWGVLHHTGNMNEAIKNSANLVKPDGFYYIALYNKKGGIFGSEYWLKIKKLYNRVPKGIKLLMEYISMLKYICAKILRGQNPVKLIRNYHVNRGMSWRRDITDWLGGYPYEFASTDEIIELMRKNFPDFTLIKLEVSQGTGCNSFLFKKIQGSK